MTVIVTTGCGLKTGDDTDSPVMYVGSVLQWSIYEAVGVVTSGAQAIEKQHFLLS